MRQTIAFHLAALYRDFAGHSARALKQLGLSQGQLPFILYVGKHPGCTQAELTRTLHMDWGHSQRSIAKLAAGGWMTKEHNKASGCYRLRLTPQGEEAFQASHDVFYSWDEARLSGLTPEERQQLLSLLGRALRQTGGPHGAV